MSLDEIVKYNQKLDNVLLTIEKENKKLENKQKLKEFRRKVILK